MALYIRRITRYPWLMLVIALFCFLANWVIEAVLVGMVFSVWYLLRVSFSLKDEFVLRERQASKFIVLTIFFILILFTTLEIMGSGFGFVTDIILNSSLLFVALLPFGFMISRNKEYFLTSCLAIIVVILIASMLGWPILLPHQLLLIKILTDPIFAIASNSHSNEDSQLAGIWLVITGILCALAVLIVYRIGLDFGGFGTAVTMAFYALLFIKLLIGITSGIGVIETGFKFYACARVIVLTLVSVGVLHILSFYFSLKFEELFMVEQLSVNNWLRLLMVCFIVFVYLVLLKVFSITIRLRG